VEERRAEAVSRALAVVAEANDFDDELEASSASSLAVPVRKKVVSISEAVAIEAVGSDEMWSSDGEASVEARESAQELAQVQVAEWLCRATAGDAGSGDGRVPDEETAIAAASGAGASSSWCHRSEEALEDGEDEDGEDVAGPSEEDADAPGEEDTDVTGDATSPKTSRRRVRKRRSRPQRRRRGREETIESAGSSPKGHQHGTPLSPAARGVVTWGDLGSDRLLGPAGGGATASAPLAVCSSTTNGWSSQVPRAAAPASTTVWGRTAVSHPPGQFSSNGNALGSWLRFSRGLPSCEDLALQVRVAAPHQCADLAAQLRASAPETYED